MTSSSPIKSYNSMPIIALGIFSIGIATVSAVAFGLMFAHHGSASVLNTLDGSGTLGICSISIITFTLSCIWGYRRHKCQQETQKTSPTTGSPTKASTVIEALRVERSVVVDRGPVLTSSTSIGIGTSTSVTSATPVAVSEDVRSSVVALQLSTLPPLIPKLITSVAGLLTALWEKQNNKHIGRDEKAAIEAAAVQLTGLIPSIQAEDLEKFYRMGTYPIPIPMLGAMDINRLKKLALLHGNSEAASMIESRRAEVIGIARKINMCAMPLEYLNDLLEIAGILEMVGDTSKAASIANVRALKTELLSIIAKIPTTDEATIKDELETFVKKLPDPKTLSDNWELNKARLNVFAAKYPPGSKERLLLDHIETLVKDIKTKKSVFPKCFYKITDTVNDVRALAPEFKDVTPHLIVKLSHKDVLYVLADKLIPASDSLLEEENILKTFETSIQLLMWIQSLGVLSLSQAYPIQFSEFSADESVLATAHVYASEGIPLGLGGRRDPGIKGIRSVSTLVSWVGWKPIEAALSLPYVKREIARTPALISVMLDTFFNLKRPGTPLRNAVLNILKDSSQLKIDLKNEANNKPYLDMAAVLTLFINHCDTMTAKIRATR